MHRRPDGPTKQEKRPTVDVFIRSVQSRLNRHLYKSGGLSTAAQSPSKEVAKQ